MTPQKADDKLQFFAELLDLGHKARESAVVRQVQHSITAADAALANSPVPDTHWADAVSFYRFAANEAIPVEKLREARCELTLRAMDPERAVLIVHDVTLLDYSPHNSKKDRRAIGDGRGRGYEYVNIGAFDAQSGHFLGVLHDTVVDQSGPDDQAMVDYDYNPLFKGFDEREKKRLRDNHRHQMAVHVRYLAPKLAPYKAIHVGDREFDDIFILHEALSTGSDILVRCLSPRNVQIREAPWIPDCAYTARQGGHPVEAGMACVNMERLIPALPLQEYKVIELDRYGRVVEKKTASGRQALLGIGACSVRLYRPAKRNKKHYYLPPDPVDLNMVVIRELEAPENGKPLQWVLFTTLPAGSLEEQKRVGLYYENRWKIEEHHRLLKSGCKVEQSRLAESEKIAKLLVVTTIAVAIVLHLRARLNLPSKGKLDNDSYGKLKKAGRELNNKEIDCGLRFYALAASLGGWFGRRGDPIGPETIMRGVARIGQTLALLENARDLLAEVKQKGLMEMLLGEDVKCV